MRGDVSDPLVRALLLQLLGFVFAKVAVVPSPYHHTLVPLKGAASAPARPGTTP
jgi:hypothetical protein